VSDRVPHDIHCQQGGLFGNEELDCDCGAVQLPTLDQLWREHFETRMRDLVCLREAALDVRHTRNYQGAELAAWGSGFYLIEWAIRSTRKDLKALGAGAVADEIIRSVEDR
jgi:hypothetical protein